MLDAIRRRLINLLPAGRAAYLGKGRKPGDQHYRAYVGPPQDYDFVAAMTFNLATTVGLRQHHRLLDIGCGSLRLGRLFIPYLNVGNYVGIEPNAWLVEEGIRNEIGESQLSLKKPLLVTGDTPAELRGSGPFDYAVAQSVFSHCGIPLIRGWLCGMAPLLASSGVLLATYLPADKDSEVTGWVYPGCVEYRESTMRGLAEEAGLRFVPLDWGHPRQSWAAFLPASAPSQWYETRPLTWNNHPSFHR